MQVTWDATSIDNFTGQAWTWHAGRRRSIESMMMQGCGMVNACAASKPICGLSPNQESIMAGSFMDVEPGQSPKVAGVIC